MEQVNETIGEVLFLLEKAVDPFKAPEERERFTKQAIEELRGVHVADLLENEDDDGDEDDLLEDFDDDFDEEEDEYGDDDDEDWIFAEDDDEEEEK